MRWGGGKDNEKKKKCQGGGFGSKKGRCTIRKCKRTGSRRCFAGVWRGTVGNGEKRGGGKLSGKQPPTKNELPDAVGVSVEHRDGGLGGSTRKKTKKRSCVGGSSVSMEKKKM